MKCYFPPNTHQSKLLPNLFKLMMVSIFLFVDVPAFTQNVDTLTIEQKIFIMKRRDTFLKNGLDIRGYDFTRYDVNVALYEASLAEKQRDSRNAWGGVLIGMGISVALMAMAGESSANSLASAAGTPGLEVSASAFLLPVAIGTGLALPCFIGAGKKRKEMEAHLQSARQLYAH